MPFFESTDPGLRSDIAKPPALPPTGDVAAAAFRQDNTVVSAFNALYNSGQFEPDPTHNPLNTIRNTPYEANHLDSFIGSRSLGETQSIMRRIDQEEADKRLLESNGVGGVLLQMVAGALDPTMALPGGMALKAGKEGYMLGRASLATAGAFAVQSAAQEAGLHASQETRTLGESAFNIGSATILGAMIGPMAAKFLTPAEHAAAVASIDRERVAMDAHAAGPQPSPPERPPTAAPPLLPEGAPGASTAAPGLSAAMGAAATDTRKLELVSSGLDKIPGVGGLVERLDPMSRLFGSESVAARRTAADLAETPLLMKENLQGIPTTAGPALDRIARLDINQTRVAVSDELDRLFAEYRFGSGDTSMPRLRAQFERFSGANADKMTFADFKGEISKALQEGDQHSIPQVQQAAQFVRGRVFDPWKNRAIEAGLFPKDMAAPKGAESYLQRVYNKQVIAAKRPEFVDRVTGWLSGEQATKASAKDRIAGFSRELEAARAELERAKSPEAAVTAKAGHDTLMAKIEKEVAAWEGNSVREAKAAIKAREKYAADTAREPGAARLGSADSAINSAVKRIIESDRGLSEQELRSQAQEITDRILSSPDGRLPYDIADGGPRMGHGGGESPRGPLAARKFAIPDALIRDYLENDIEHIVNTHLRTMVPDVLLTERFGDVRMTEAFRKINDEYAGLIDGAKSEKARTKLEKERQGVIRDIAAIRDRTRHLYGIPPEGPLRQAARVTGAVKNFNVVTSMGMATLSSLPDMAGAVFRHGLGAAFNDAWSPWISGLMGGAAYKEAKSQFRAMGIGVETILAQRSHALNDVMDAYRPQSRVERSLQWGADKFQLLNLLAPWTDWAKTTASLISSSELLRATRAAVEGKATKRQLRSLGESGIDGAMAERIHRAFEQGGEVRDGVHLPNTGDWTDLAARRAFEGAVAREADIAVVTPGAEKPLWMSQPILSVFGQFKSFTASATQRILIANLQRRDAQVMQGLLFSMGLGMLSYKINSLTGGAPASERPQDWVKEAVSRGNLLGWLEEGNSIASKVTRGGVDIYLAVRGPVGKGHAARADGRQGRCHD
jgi:hypothetical protein